MSWHTSVLAIEGDHLDRAAELLRDLGFPSLTLVGEVDGDGAGSSSLSGKAVGLVQNWTLVWDPMMFISDDPSGVFEDSIWSSQLESRLRALSSAGRVYSLLTEGASSTHGFAWYRQGRRERLWLWQEGAIVLDDGPPL